MKKIIILVVILMLVSISFISTANSIAINREKKDTNNIHKLDGPIVWAELDPPEPDGENGWYVSPVIVYLFAEDDQTGVDSILYVIDGDGYSRYFRPFMVGCDGLHAVKFMAYDKVGNPSEVKEVYFKIDETTPYTEITKKVTGISEIKFTAKCIDLTSKMDYVELYVDGELYRTLLEPTRKDGRNYYYYEFDWEGLGEHKFKVIAYDNAGNSRESNELSINKCRLRNDIYLNFLQRYMIKNILKLNFKNL